MVAGIKSSRGGVVSESNGSVSWEFCDFPEFFTLSGIFGRIKSKNDQTTCYYFLMRPISVDLAKKTRIGELKFWPYFATAPLTKDIDENRWFLEYNYIRRGKHLASFMKAVPQWHFRSSARSPLFPRWFEGVCV